MRERFIPILRRLGKAEECVVTDANFSRRLAAKYASKLVPSGEVNQVIDGIDQFASDLFNIESVQAVAFLAVREQSCPTSLSSVVFMPLIPGDVSARQVFDAAATADAAFATRLGPFLPSGLRFVNTVDVSMGIIKPAIIRRWSADPTLELLQFIKFRRI